MKHEYNNEELEGLLHDCKRDQELFDLVVRLPRAKLEAEFKKHHERVNEREDQDAYICTIFEFQGERIRISTDMYEGRVFLRFANPGERATP